MAEVTMPRLSDTMEEGTIASWLKKPGEEIKKGDVLAQIETDKATMDLTAFEAGTLQEILAPEGSTVAIGKPVARIGSGAPAAPAAPAAGKETKGSSPEAAAESSPPAADESSPAGTKESSAPPTEGSSAPPTTESSAPPAEGAEPPAAEAAGAEPVGAEAAGAEPVGAEAAGAEPRPSISNGETAPSSVPTRTEQAEGANGKVRASPMARHMAAEHGLDLAELKGSGPRGRVIRADVEAALESKPSGTGDRTDDGDAGEGGGTAANGTARAEGDKAQADGEERVPLSQMRRTIARRMAESTRTVPHFFLNIAVDATELVKLRKQVLEQTAEAGIKITFNDMVLKAAALALRKVPDVNVSFAEDSLIRHKHIHIGVAVATDRGLIVPVVRDADQKSLGQIARETRDLAERASSGKLQPPDYSGGTFTISNLGMFGIEQFNAVINPPESAILAVGAITREPAEHEGQIVVRERMKLTLSVDHRALDGAIGARYLQALQQLLEKPMLLLV
jgi:pyruvate dehydrogenase E2 component (dihydrolipoamide acetyltransferase)